MDTSPHLLNDTFWKAVGVIAGSCSILALVLYSDRLSQWRANRAERLKWKYWNHS